MAVASFRRTMAVLLATAIFSLSAGCASSPAAYPPKPDPSTPEGADPSVPPADARAPLATPTLRQSYSGTILWRLGGDESPRSSYTGDPPTFCFIVPPETASFTGTLAWDVPEQMGLEFYAMDTEEAHRSYDDATSAFEDTSPIVLKVEAPVQGTWFAFAGPSVAGAAIKWKLDLEWTIARANATLEETIYAGEPCT